MSLFITHAHLAIFALCGLLAAHFLFSRARNPMPSRLLGFNYLLYACQSLLLVGTLNNWLGSLTLLRPILAMLIGPLFYFYFCSVKTRSFTFSLANTWHLLPAIAVTLMFIAKSPLLNWLDVFIILSFTSYLVYVARFLLKGPTVFSAMKGNAGDAFRLVSLFAALIAVGLTFELAVFLELLNNPDLRQSLSLALSSFALLLIFIFIVFTSLRRHPVLEWMFTLGEQLSERKTPELDAQYAHELFVQWQELVDKKNLHKLEFGISLKDAARKLGVPARHLSNAINQEFGDSYSRYLNFRRVLEAQTLFDESPVKSVIDVMLEAGFSSKSNFNKEFLRISGKTPSAYREEACQKQLKESPCKR